MCTQIKVLHSACLALLFLTTALSSNDAVNASSNSQRWVVLTTVSYPLEAVRKLAALDGWKVVVVADKKTPVDWQLDNVTFLGVEQQQKLPYKIMQHLPWNNYGRKNIGYMYAIAHGAEVIYETDDDNILTASTILQLVSASPSSSSPELSPNVTASSPPGQYTMLDMEGCTAVDYNPYPLFGQGQMWPRGLPLASIKQPIPTCFKRVPARPLIQQGLANNDPDVDAIYRLTLPLGAEFDSQAFSVLLPRGTMTPFNSQNTLFLYDALWALLLPVTTTMRVCDIWRGYWAQRLLWDIGGSLAFIAPTVKQNRNPHTVFKDFQEELDLYNKAGALLQDLRQWQPNSADLPGRLVEVAQLMASKGYWAAGDVQLMEAWASDLTTVGYKFPAFSSAATTPVSDQTPPALPRATWKQHSFLFPQRWCKYMDIVLVVNFNFVRLNGGEVDSAHLMGLLHAAYKPMFKEVFFTGNMVHATGRPHPNFVGCANTNVHGAKTGGHMAYVCLAEVMAKVQDGASAFAPVRTGFLYINDDVMFSPCMLTVFNHSNIWYDYSSVTSHAAARVYFNNHATGSGFTNVSDVLSNSGWHWEDDHSYGRQRGVLRHHTKAALANAYGWMAEQVHRRLDDAHLSGHKFFGIGQADAFYVPGRFTRQFITWAHHMRRYHVFSEVAVLNILALLGEGPSDYDIFTLSALWDGRREAAQRCVADVLPLGRSMNQAVVSALSPDCQPAGGSTQRQVGKRHMRWQRLPKNSSPELFMVHPLKLSNNAARQHWVNWWQSQSCAGLPAGVLSPCSGQ